MAIIACWNGQFGTTEDAMVPLEDRGHQFGDGVYEVVRVYSGRPFLLDWHLERLAVSLAVLDIENPHSQAQWTELIGEAIRRSGEAEATVYWQVTRGHAPRTHAFPAVAHPSVSLVVRPVTTSAASAANGQETLLCLADERWANAYVKSINLLPNAVAKESARRFGAFEALLVRDGQITEGSSTNAWFVRDGRLYTAPADRFILAGVTRRFVLQLAAELGLSVREERLPLDELASVDEVFVTSSTIEIQPIGRVVADGAQMSDLYQLTAQRPSRLVADVQDAQVLWQSGVTASVTTSLQSAFDEALQRFRNYENVVVG